MDVGKLTGNLPFDRQLQAGLETREAHVSRCACSPRSCDEPAMLALVFSASWFPLQNTKAYGSVVVRKRLNGRIIGVN